MSDLQNRLLAEIDKIAIIDTHEHLTLPHQLAEMGRFDFGWLFRHYLNSDLVSAGMPQSDVDELISADSKLSPLEKWRLVEPWFRAISGSGYWHCIQIAMRDLYGIEDLSADTVGPLSDKMDAVNRDTWTREVFDRAGIEIALEQNLWLDTAYPKQAYPDIFLYDMADPFTNLDIGLLSRDSGIEIGSLSDFLRATDWHFERLAHKASAYKISRAYNRPIFFDEVPLSTAERVFADLLKNPAERKDVRALEDYVCHYCIAKCGEYDLPVKVHTGIQDGNSNDITNSRPGLLVNLLIKYPNVRFDLYHIGWPYSDELIAIAKQFPSVWADFCWVWAISPSVGRRYLHEVLETVPLNKVHGFGGDYFMVEGSYGHSVIARREIARVLAEKVEDGWFTEEQALSAAGRLLRENALENFRIEAKREFPPIP